MSLVIDDPDLERDLRALAAQRGERVEDVVRRALRSDGATRSRDPAEDNAGQETEQARQKRLAEARRIIDRFAALDVLDPRAPDEIIGYDDHGLPT
ncbi:hypothetical protein CKO28_04090 [Rhodovibrio sodomensis]|uniref:PSK operon transcription factor n=1 Tax=Rhodovibrio sodomensis TaxID=1088 RepID=A0ABS1DBC6_9PROT|nr:type II toxin-antitoxin system VapB family antitoxin [Rhodovibrio sodomensis]MBK1667222.1 hypothetical protein [Rhodovibrio sodomensis]